MKRILAILLLGFLALGIAGFSSEKAAAAPASCLPPAASILDQVDSLAQPASLTEKASPRAGIAKPDEPALACNSSCARSCSSRFSRCTTRSCRDQYQSCIRSCGC